MDDAVSKTIANGSTASNPAELKSYGSDQDSLKDVIKDASGNATEFLKDSNGYVQTITDVKGRVTKVERDNEGRPTKIIKPDLTYTQLTYDQATGDLLERYESASDTSEAYAYNQFGQLLSYKDPLNRVKSNSYDPVTGLLVKETDPNGNHVDYTYTNLGLILTSKNSLGHTSTYSYGADGNVVQVTAPMGEATAFVRDAAGNVTTKTNAKSQTTVYSFDLLNRLTSVKTPGNHTTTYSYLPTGELDGILNPAGFTTQFEYDQLGRLVRKVSPKGQVTKLFYDNNDNIVKEISPNGDIKTFEYDESNQLTKKILPDNLYQFDYDDKGNLISAANNSSSQEMTYVSILGKDYLKSVSSTANDFPGYTVSYGFNGSGKRTSMSSDYLNMTYTLDQGYRLNGIQNSLGQNFGFGYDAANRLTSITRPNAINSSLFYDNNSFLTQYIHKQGATNIESLIYGRDQIGNRTSLTTSKGTHSYSYDSDNQLLTASHPEADSLHALESFTYDSLGNRTSDNQGTFEYDDKKFRLDQDYKYLYVYDLNGNLISKQERGLNGKVWNYSYNSENQLTLAESFSGSNKLKSVSFSYDVQGRRIKKTVDDLQNSSHSERKYVYNSGEIIAELNEDNEVLAKYTHSGLRTDDVLAAEVTSDGVAEGLAATAGSYLYLKDGLGSVLGITNASGDLIQRYVYSSFGKLLKTVDGLGNEISPVVRTAYTYTNRELDSETGLYYYRARYYDSHSGRFLQEDPYPGLLRIPATINSAYVYTLNSPATYTDPDGKIIPVIIAAAVLGGLANSYFNRHNGKSFLQNFAIGAAVGAGSAIVGIGVGAAVGAWIGGGLAGAALGGAAGGAASSIFAQLVTTGSVNWGYVAFGAAFGAISGVVAYGISQGTSSAAMNNSAEVIDSVNKSAVQSLIESNGTPGQNGVPGVVPPTSPNTNPPLPGPIYVPGPM